MTPITMTIDIDRPPADVYAYATDPTRFPEWQRDVVRVEMAGSLPATTGSTFKSIRRFAGAEQALTQEVIEAEAPRRWTARATTGPIRPTATLLVEPIDGGRASRVTFLITYEARGIGRAILPLVIRQTEQGAPSSFRTLKGLLERERAVTDP